MPRTELDGVVFMVRRLSAPSGVMVSRRLHGETAVRTLRSHGEPPAGLKALGNDLLVRRAKMKHFEGKVRLFEGSARHNMGIAFEQSQENLAR